jgi:exopolyphosphatase
MIFNADTDRALAEKLDLMEGPAASGTAAQLYRALLDSRTQVDGLSSRQRLRKDYKRWRHGGVDYGIATVPCALQEWLDDPEAGDISGALAATARDEGLSLLLVMTTFMDASGSGLRRQLIVWAPDSSLAGECASFLVSATFLDWEAQLGIAPSLSLESLKLSDTSLLAFSQSNGKASRKQMQPAVAAFLESR